MSASVTARQIAEAAVMFCNTRADHASAKLSIRAHWNAEETCTSENMAPRGDLPAWENGDLVTCWQVYKPRSEWCPWCLEHTILRGNRQYAARVAANAFRRLRHLCGKVDGVEFLK